MFHTIVKTPIGELLVMEADEKIARIDFEELLRDHDIGIAKNTTLLKEAATQLRDYFKGTRRDFYLPLNYDGTDFQNKVWKMLERIPFGETTTYGDLAKRMKNPQLARAVGMCCARNKIPIVIPCHRVTGTAGLTGFGGGLWRKEWLLRHEAEHSGLFG